VPDAPHSRTNPVDPDRELAAVADFLQDRKVIVLSGAGCSTESGIPDYRGPGGSFRRRQPMRLQEFMGSHAARQRYWARSARGWTRVAEARPNAAHHAVTRLESAGFIQSVITQNVDGLHQAAGTQTVLELHGSLAGVRCTECDQGVRRHSHQQSLERMNQELSAAAASRFAPDGDADLDQEIERRFVVPSCELCDGILKPDVVFFGENVPRDRLQKSWKLYEAADAILVLGSSLTVFSGRRFVLRAAKERRPIAIVNEGPTRCDEMAAVRVERRLGVLLPLVADALTSEAFAGPARR